MTEQTTIASLTWADLEIAPDLYGIAENWRLNPAETERPCGVIHGPVMDAASGEYRSRCGRVHKARIYRCTGCDEEVFPADETGVLRHMFTSHGYRMNGKRYDNQNKEITGE